MKFESPTRLSDAELLARVRQLAQGEQQTTAALVAHLSEIEDRKLYLEEGCRSLFTYCTQVLHLAEHAAYNRIEAARAARRFPVVLAYLERGDLHLTAVRLLSPLLTQENHRAVLAAAAHKSKHDLEELVARLRPQPDVPAAVRRLPAKTAQGSTAATLAQQAALEGLAQSATRTPRANVALAAAVAAAAARSASTSSSRANVAPLAPGRYRVQFTTSATTYDNLRRAQELLRHRIPNGDPAEIVALALERLVRDLEKRKLGAADRPRGSHATRPQHSRHIPAAVRRAVWRRDHGRCTFTSPSGSRCRERGQLEFDHVRPHADGGSAHVDNVRLLCRRHNQYEARRFFGTWQAEGAAHG